MPRRSKLKLLAQRLAPHGFFSLEYRRSASRVMSPRGDRNRLFEEFLGRCEGPCLQIAVKDEVGRKFGDNWTSVDKFDHSELIDRHDDVEALDFADDSFNAVVCWSVLEHVPHPHRAIAELRRVLRPGGLIWVQLPFLYPFHSAPHDYWRVTPQGLRIWMEDFDEQACACDYWAGTRLIAATYFMGSKPDVCSNGIAAAEPHLEQRRPALATEDAG